MSEPEYLPPEDDYRDEPQNPIISQSAMNAIITAEIGQQVATARAYPRNISDFHRKSRDLACQDEATAEEMFYSLRRGSKPIIGASIRFAEIIAHTWQNNRAGARVVAEGDDFIVAQGVFQDMETNRAITLERQRRIVNAKGERYNVDMIGVTGNAAASVALRDAIIHGIPKPFWSPIFQAARAVALGQGVSLRAKVDKVIEVFAKREISADELMAYLGIKTVADFDEEQVLHAKGTLTAIKDGDLSIESVRAATFRQHGSQRTDVSAVLKNGNGKKDAPAADVAAKTETKADAPVAKDVDKAIEDTVAKVMSLSDDEKSLITGLNNALQEATTIDELTVVEEEFAEAVASHRDVIRDMVREAFAVRSDSLKPAAKPSRGKTGALKL